ncbi:hypothetical protein BRARA_J01085 [Brassica rapa]|uniref:FBD domain-containing protein n=1 Tax=Brassica campestris TaxID=3711 RepID=A0A397XL77_BRACM|nr:hypothetical protein BRARA_J01085 [Brassica rapa]
MFELIPPHEDIGKLLKRCAALEDLVITRTRDDNKRPNDDKEIHGFWINAPALETLNINDTVSNFLMLKFMPEVTKANIQVTCVQTEKFIGSLTSIQHLSLCSRSS